MRLRRLRGFFVMNLLFFFTMWGLVSCSSQQQDQQGLDSYQEQEDVDQAQSQDSEGEDGDEEASEGQGYFDANQGNYQAMEGGNNLLANEGNYGMEGSDSSLANIMNDMNMAQPDAMAGAGGEAMEGEEISDTGMGLEGSAPESVPEVAMSAGGVISGSAGPPAGPGLPEMGSKMSYVVVKGDTLAKISRRIYGSISKWRELAEVSGIENPGMIFPGDLVYYQLSEESLAFASEYENVERGEVVVKAGETLETIAEKVYGNAENWKSIWRQNSQVVNPDQLEEGARIYFVASQKLVSEPVKKSVATQSASLSETEDAPGHLSKAEVAPMQMDSSEETLVSQKRWKHDISRWDV